MYIKKSILTLVALCATTLASAAEPVYREISAHLAGESSKVVMFEGEYDRIDRLLGGVVERHLPVLIDRVGRRPDA